MSMPSDVTPDVTDAMEADGSRQPPRRPRPVAWSVTFDISPQQFGFAVAALVTFVGVAMIGPRVARRRETLADRAKRRADEARRQAVDTGRRAGKRLRRLGGGVLRR